MSTELAPILVSRKEASRRLGLSLSQLKGLHAKGVIRLIYVNSRVIRVPLDDVDNFSLNLTAYNRRQQQMVVVGHARLGQETIEGLNRYFGSQWRRWEGAR